MDPKTGSPANGGAPQPARKSLTKVLLGQKPSPKSSRSARKLFFIATLVSFAFFIPLLLSLNHAFFHFLQQEAVSTRKLLNVGSELPPSVLGTAMSPNETNANFEWWLAPGHFTDPNYSAVHGMSIRLRENPSLMRQAFPGYPRTMAADQRMWNRYFSHQFTFDIRVPDLAADREHFLKMSWVGSLEIFRGYGADTVVLGHSESYRELYPDLLAKTIGDSAGRVLFSMRGWMTPESVVKTSEYIQEEIRNGRQKKPARLVWGYPFWFYYNKGKSGTATSMARLQEREIHQFFASQPAGRGKIPIFAIGLQDFFKLPGWKEISKLTLSQIKDKYIYGKSPHEKWPTKETRALDAGTLRKNERGFDVNRRDIAFLNERVVSATPEISPFALSAKSDCSDLTGLARQFNAAVDSLSKAGEKVFIYLVPSNPFQTEPEPSCLGKFAREMLLSRENHRIVVRTSGWKEYGLEWSDFVSPTDNPEVLHLDPIHPNFSGARKVTAAIGEWIRTH